jgi:plasmid stability protein
MAKKRTAQVIVRNLDPGVVDALKARARANGRSLEAELRILLEREAALGSAGEEAVPYLALRDRLPRVKPTKIVFPRKPVPLEPFEPIKTKGKPASEMIIEDRR